MFLTLQRQSLFANHHLLAETEHPIRETLNFPTEPYELIQVQVRRSHDAHSAKSAFSLGVSKRLATRQLDSTSASGSHSGAAPLVSGLRQLICNDVLLLCEFGSGLVCHDACDRYFYFLTLGLAEEERVHIWKPQLTFAKLEKHIDAACLLWFCVWRDP